MRAFRKKDQKTVAYPCWVADRIWERFKGLMGKDRLEPGTGLLLEPCNSIHTFFMRFPIDVLYLSADGKVLKIRRGMKPWRMDIPVFGARSVLELPMGGAGEVIEGDTICLN